VWIENLRHCTSYGARWARCLAFIPGPLDGMAFPRPFSWDRSVFAPYGVVALLTASRRRRSSFAVRPVDPGSKDIAASSDSRPTACQLKPQDPWQASMEAWPWLPKNWTYFYFPQLEISMSMSMSMLRASTEFVYSSCPRARESASYRALARALALAIAGDWIQCHAVLVPTTSLQ